MYIYSKYAILVLRNGFYWLLSLKTQEKFAYMKKKLYLCALNN